MNHMSSKVEKKLNSQRPGSSIRHYDVSDLENSEKQSKLSKLPKRTYSLEGKENTIARRRSANSHLSSTTSMIPRLERMKFSRRFHSPANSMKEFKTNQKREKPSRHPQSASNAKDCRNAPDERNLDTKESPSQTVVKLNPVETKLDEDFVQFKSNILKIPEFWSDADQTVKNILKNAVSIVTKQYPTADVEAFEIEIQNILKATEIVKQEILTKTEDIVNQANKIYSESYEGTGPTDEELKIIADKMEELRNNVTGKNNAFGDLLKCGAGEMDGVLKLDGKLPKDKIKKDETDDKKKNDNSKSQKCVSSKMSKMKVGNAEGTMMQSCGDILRQDANAVIRLINDSVMKSNRDPRFEDKSCQTMSLWASEMVKREESLKTLNDQILQLHNLCKDHITKFKSFNFQIKLRGNCGNKVSVPPMSTAISSRVEVRPPAKNKLSLYGKGYEYLSPKPRDVDIHQKNRLISQQKKLLHVRDELIEMLKNRCNVEVKEI